MARNARDTRSTYKWSKAETDWLIAHPGEPRSTMEQGFRKAFPKVTGTSVALAGKAYHLGHGSGVKGLDARIASLEAKLDGLRVQRANAEETAAAKLVQKTQDEIYEAFPRPPTAAQLAIVKGAAKAPVAKKTAKKPAGKNAATPKPKASKVTVTKAAAARK